MATTKRNEVITMPMLRVECSDYRVSDEHGEWPKFVQCLPPIGSLIESSEPVERAYVADYCFMPDGVIELILSEEKPH